MRIFRRQRAVALGVGTVAERAVLLKVAAPAAIDAAVAATGFFTFFGSGPAAGVWAPTAIVSAMRNVRQTQ